MTEEICWRAADIIGLPSAPASSVFPKKDVGEYVGDSVLPPDTCVLETEQRRPQLGRGGRGLASNRKSRNALLALFQFQNKIEVVSLAFLLGLGFAAVARAHPAPQ